MTRLFEVPRRLEGTLGCSRPYLDLGLGSSGLLCLVRKFLLGSSSWVLRLVEHIKGQRWRSRPSTSSLRPARVAEGPDPLEQRERCVPDPTSVRPIVTSSSKSSKHTFPLHCARGTRLRTWSRRSQGCSEVPLPRSLAKARMVFTPCFFMKCLFSVLGFCCDPVLRSSTCTLWRNASESVSSN